MKDKILIAALFIIASSAVIAGDGEMEDFLYNSSPVQQLQTQNVSSTYKARQYRRDAEKMGLKRQPITSRMPENVKSAIKEYNDYEYKLKNIYVQLADAYEKGDQNKISEFENTAWKLKERMKMANQKKTFAYQVDEFEKGVREFPNSNEMKALLQDVKNDVANYFKYSEIILASQEKQRQITEFITKKQKLAKIIRQKEVLNKMQNEYSSSFGAGNNE